MKKQNLILTTKAGHQFRVHADNVPNDVEGKDIAERLNAKYKGTDFEVINTMELDDAEIHGDTFILLPEDFGFTDAEEIKEEPTEEVWANEKQYNELKAKHPEALLLFRCGDWYLTYNDDAVKASEVLGITLTRNSRIKDAEGKGLREAMFPYHTLDTYLPKLIRAGVRVAICDQMEEPKKAKKLLKK